MKSLGLKDEKLFYIGGIVRDEVLGRECFDIDLTYIGNAIEYSKTLDGEILQVNEPFGTVRMLIDNQEVDIASTRDEVYEKKGHLPRVSDIGCSLKKDVLRRDFTINALAKSTLTAEIIDYTGGLKDIESKTLRILHDNSFIDDPTRIVRGLKFAVRFGFELDKHTLSLQESYLKNINYDMSYKRLKKELKETFDLNLQFAYKRFVSQKIYKLIGATEQTPPRYNIEKLINKYPVDNVWLVYIGWHSDIKNLPLTKEENRIIAQYRELLDTDIPKDDFSIYKAFVNMSKEAILLYTISTQSDKGLRFFEISDIKPSINGKDLIDLGYTPSDKFKECFDYILEQKLKNPDLYKSDEINLAKSFFESN